MPYFHKISPNEKHSQKYICLPERTGNHESKVDDSKLVGRIPQTFKISFELKQVLLNTRNNFPRGGGWLGGIIENKPSSVDLNEISCENLACQYIY